jgi:hypothetical protein
MVFKKKKKVLKYVSFIFKIPKYAKVCEMKIVLFDSVEHELNLYPG